MIIPDVNLLVYAYNTDAPFHPQARHWWEACVAGSQPVAIPWAVALGYLRLMTNARVLPRPLTMAVALGHLRLLSRHPVYSFLFQ